LVKLSIRFIPFWASIAMFGDKDQKLFLDRAAQWVCKSLSKGYI